MFTENLTKQDEEIEALSSIYGNDWTTESDVTRSYKIRVEENKHEAILYVTMPPDYPSQSPPKFELSAPWMERKDKASLHQALNDVYLENIGETVVYQWVEKIRETLLTMEPPEEKKKVEQNQAEENLDLSQVELMDSEIVKEVIMDSRCFLSETYMKSVVCLN